MDNVTVKLQGGLGNYLFQIAATYAYGIEYNKIPIFNHLNAIRVHKPIMDYRSTILSRINLTETINYNGYTRYIEKTFNYDEIPSIDGNVILEGYFQSEKYFNKYEEQIKGLFAPTQEMFDEIETKFGDVFNQDTCSIHVRRGDYVKLSQHHPLCGNEYYDKAIKEIPKGTKFLVFSDDTEWCRKNFKEDKFIIIDNNNDIVDLYLMSKCKHNIIANSSFSWWAAWLNDNNNKIVVSPKTWFGPAKNNLNTKDVYCEKWIKL